MPLRRFDHLAVELSVAAGELAPRYALWLRLQALGWDPMALGREEALAFVEAHLDAFLSEQGITIRSRALRQLRKRVLAYDPDQPTPEEILARVLGADQEVER